MMNKIKALFSAQDMTLGSPTSCLLKFSIPLLIGNFAQMLYSTIDSIVVGKYEGDAALSALGISMPIVNIFLVIFMAIGAGVTIMVSQYFGAKEYSHLGDSIGNSITLIAIMSVVITAVATPLTGPILNLIDTPPESFDMAKAYLSVIFIGAAGNGFYNIMSGILRGLGESVFPLLVLLFTTILNTILDISFVAGLQMGVAGAAWATIIAQTISAIICLIKVLTMKGVVKIKAPMLKLKKNIVMMIIRLGVPNGVSMGIMFASSIVVQSLINKMGYMVSAAITAMMRLDGFAVLPSQTFSMAASTFTGQNTGAGRMDRVKQGSRSILIISLIVSLVLVAAMLLFGRNLLGLFTDTEELINMGMSFIYIMVPAYFAMAIQQCYSGVVRGAGEAMAPMWISLAVNVALRVPLAYLLAFLSRSDAYPNGDPKSIFMSLLIAMIIGVIVTLLYFRFGNWRTKSIVGKDSDDENTTVKEASHEF